MHKQIHEEGSMTLKKKKQLKYSEIILKCFSKSKNKGKEIGFLIMKGGVNLGLFIHR